MTLLCRLTWSSNTCKELGNSTYAMSYAVFIRVSVGANDALIDVYSNKYGSTLLQSSGHEVVEQRHRKVCPENEHHLFRELEGKFVLVAGNVLQKGVYVEVELREVGSSCGCQDVLLCHVVLCRFLICLLPKEPVS